MLACARCQTGIVNYSHSSGRRRVMAPRRSQEQSLAYGAGRPCFFRGADPVGIVFLPNGSVIYKAGEQNVPIPFLLKASQENRRSVLLPFTDGDGSMLPKLGGNKFCLTLWALEPKRK